MGGAVASEQNSLYPTLPLRPPYKQISRIKLRFALLSLIHLRWQIEYSINSRRERILPRSPRNGPLIQPQAMAATLETSNRRP